MTVAAADGHASSSDVRRRLGWRRVFGRLRGDADLVTSLPENSQLCDADASTSAPLVVPADAVVVFVAAWAPPAAALQRALADVSGVVFVDVDEHPQVADRHVVRTLPTVIRLRSDREDVRLIGAVAAKTVAKLAPAPPEVLPA